jgi:membrane protein required for colicin V production
VDGSVTAFDAVVLGVLLLSGLLALVRGFVREALSVAAFIAAALGALWMLPVLRDPLRGVIQPAWAADITAVVGAFLLIFLAVTLVTSSISKQLGRGDEPGLLDRLAGLAFGVVRGLVVLALFVLAYTWVRPSEPSRWLTEARLYPLISSTAAALQELAPETSRVATTPLPPAASQPAAVPAAPAAPAAASEPETPAEEAGYGETTRARLDQLIGARAGEEAEDTEGDAQ